MAVEYTGAGAVRKNYGPILSPTTKPSPEGQKESTFGNRVEVQYDFTYDNLPTSNASDAVFHTFPAGAIFESVVWNTQVDFAGGTDYTVGLVTPAGVAVDVDGFITAAQGAVANLVTTTPVICGRGACVVEAPDAAGTAHVDGDGLYAAGSTGPIPSVASQLKVTANGTFTAGRARIWVRYIDPNS
jgi:hypothetical protein